MIQNFMLAFIPIFVAVDAIGVLPIFVSFTHGVRKKERSKIIRESIITALCLAIGFVFLGKAVFSFLKITVGDFMIAGGLILLCIAILDILNPGKKRRIPGKELGSVPLGTPLIVGPAVLTTSLIIIAEYGTIPTLMSILVNVLLAGLIFSYSDILIKFLGDAGSKALSKIAHLLLAAIAIMMMRKGMLQILMELGAR
ncbi:MAG: MarC family protein [Candidatus Omnitrophica bacterium]|nr:MarC family protein [Candidatus Omnitrophota bacterium]MBU4590534.1 MarC family protein [Candidatus Omnitrophota bacterium]